MPAHDTTIPAEELETPFEGTAASTGESIADGAGQDSVLVTELIKALREMRPGPGEVTTLQQAIIEEHAELKRVLRGPALVFRRTAHLARGPEARHGGDQGRAARRYDARTDRARTERRPTPSGVQQPRDTLITVTVVPPGAAASEVTVFTPLGVATSKDIVNNWVTRWRKAARRQDRVASRLRPMQEMT